MSSFDPAAAVAFVAAAWLMVHAGVGKKKLLWRSERRCPHCGLRHARGNCATLRR